MHALPVMQGSCKGIFGRRLVPAAMQVAAFAFLLMICHGVFYAWAPTVTLVAAWAAALAILLELPQK